MLGVLAPGPLARAQQDGPSVAITAVDDTAYPRLRAFVSVTGADGAPVTGLGSGAFTVTVGDQELSPDVTSAAETPLALVLAIDASESMLGGRLELATQAASSLIRALGPDDRVAVLAFRDETEVVVPLTTDRARVVNGLTGLQAAGGRALYEAVQAATYVAVMSGAPRTAIVLLADGPGDATAGVAAEAAVATAADSGVPVYAIGLTGEAAPFLSLLATATDGRFRAANTGDLSTAFEQVAAAIQGQYALDFEADAPADGAEATFSVSATVDGATLTAAASFTRGATAETPSPGDDGGSALEAPQWVARAVLVAVATVVVLAVIGALALAAVRWVRNARERRAQLEIIEPNRELAARQGLPERDPSVVRVTPKAAEERGNGILVEKGGEGRTFELGAGPIVIGTSRRLANIVISGGDIAPEHVRIWLRGGRYLIHHVGGMSRKTYVNGYEADWVTLDPGDELRVGDCRFVFRDLELEADRPNPFLPKGRITPLR